MRVLFLERATRGLQPTVVEVSHALSSRNQLLFGGLRLGFDADLPQMRGKIEVNPASRNLSGSEIVFVKGAPRNLDLFAGCLDIGKGAFVHGFKTPFHRDQIFSVG
jgi:hypothetical protein